MRVGVCVRECVCSATFLHFNNAKVCFNSFSLDLLRQLFSHILKHQVTKSDVHLYHCTHICHPRDRCPVTHGPTYLSFCIDFAPQMVSPSLHHSSESFTHSAMAWHCAYAVVILLDSTYPLAYTSHILELPCQFFPTGAVVVPEVASNDSVFKHLSSTR